MESVYLFGGLGILIAVLGYKSGKAISLAVLLLFIALIRYFTLS